ncbi:hypothetical protein F0562_015597 [Nyssa sinensis]|uniref:Uncharacterized protein n=1 Tax=Nyssa sinensis TaxID=561372 RepID=A0A5J4ZHF0_9ASTE|nr:hypothetical protein F0562_015597 [Nyssa sinensis]
MSLVNSVWIRNLKMGLWEFRSKSKQEICSLEDGCRQYMLALEGMSSEWKNFLRVITLPPLMNKCWFI